MKWFYIEKENFWKILLISFAVLSLLPLTFFLIYILCLGPIFFLFRKNRTGYNDFIASNNDVCLSPIEGRVIKIEPAKEGDYPFKQVMTMEIGILNTYGLVCPFDSVIESMDIKLYKDKEKDLLPLDKFSKGDLDCKINLENKNGFRAMVRIQKVPIFGMPKLWIRTGDRAKAGACFGINPYGGKVKMYFPENIKFAVGSGDRLVAGETIIAGIKG